MKTTITVTYRPDEDILLGAIDDQESGGALSVPWSDDVRFSFTGHRLVSFEIKDFRYFTDFVPFYKLFGAEFVGWLSDLQSDVTSAHRAESTAFDVMDQSRSGKRFEKALAAG